MPERRPWLDGLIVCAHGLEAQAVRTALRSRGLRVRSIPAGRARAAWNAVTEGGQTIAVVVSGRGREAARAAAGYWALQARVLVALGAGPGTGAVAPPALLLDGEATLGARARTGMRPGDDPAVEARIASVDTPVTADEARVSLAAAGIAAVDGETDTWREAAGLLGIPMLALRVLCDHPVLPDRLARLEAAGPAGRSAWRTALVLAGHPGDRRRLRAADAARVEAAGVGARCAVAACLGPG